VVSYTFNLLVSTHAKRLLIPREDQDYSQVIKSLKAATLR
jgi:hypothetical protein